MTLYRSKALRVIALVARILLGVFFVVSAVAKLVDIDRFEIYVYSYNLLPLGLSQVTARLVIVAELLMGVGLIANIWNRFVNVCTVLALTGFTIFLGYAVLIGRTDSCQCMGSLLEIDPLHSILKNALLLLWTVFAMGARPWGWRPRWFVWLPVMLAPLVTVFILSAPDTWLFGRADEVYNPEKLTEAMAPEGDLAELHLDEGRHVVAFLTPGCRFCKMADQKLTSISQRHGLDERAIVYLMLGDDSTQTALQVDSTTYQRAGYIIPKMTFLYITYGQRPLIFLMDEGVVKATCHYRNISESQIKEFLLDEED